jgi:DNA-binding MarR family transcriptional regulator
LKPPESETEQVLCMLLDIVAEMVRLDNPDFTLRQLAVFLTCYSQEDAHTVRGLAAHLRVSKPAISRALDRLGEFGLIRREMDPFDRRSILVQRTPKGAAFYLFCKASSTKRPIGE